MSCTHKRKNAEFAVLFEINEPGLEKKKQPISYMLSEKR
jgi:hypothetical protein